METPICFSQYFVNKQHVRSFRNITKSCFWKNEDNSFYKNIFEDDYMVSELSTDFRIILAELRINLQSKCKTDFKEFFSADSNVKLKCVNKAYIFTNCWKGLREIIPNKIFGNSHNIKIFKGIIKSIIYSMKRQHFFLTKCLLKWDMSVPPWKFIPNIAKSCLKKIILWICSNILAPMISLNFYITTTKIDANENKLYYFWKNQWQSFYDKIISNMILTKVITKSVPYSLGKKIKKNHSYADKLRLRTLWLDIPKLDLILKPNNECRPIVRYKSGILSPTEKYKVKGRLEFLKLLVGKPHRKLEDHYSATYLEWVKANKPKLYFVKTDLRNAFGSVNKDKLLKIISERHATFQKNEKCLYVKKKVTQQYKDMLYELRKPLLIRVGSTIYEWREGLVQGYKYSPALSELYYAYMDKIYFSNHLITQKNNIKLFIRVVDDYLYITDSLEDALTFLEALKSYRNVNYDKTVVNFPHEHIKFSEQITFFGYIYNTSNMEVSRANNIYTGQICYKIAFTSAVSNLYKFVENRIGQSGIQINTHIFNMQYNNEELIWRHVFITFCLSANKFCTILAVLCDEKEMNIFLTLYKKRVTVKLTNSILETLLKTKPSDVLFMYCINHFRYLAWKALYLCAKETKKCSGLIPLVKDELAKSNCLFGKWRAHANRIDINGESQHTALKEICRRTDLRKTFKDLDNLPCGFECYDHKKEEI